MKVEWQGRQRELKELVDLHREAVATSETGVAQELALVTSRLQMEYGLWYAAERTCLETPGGDRNWRLLLRKWQARRRLGSEPQWEDLQRARELAPEPQRDLAPELLRELSELQIVLGNQETTSDPARANPAAAARQERCFRRALELAEWSGDVGCQADVLHSMAIEDGLRNRLAQGRARLWEAEKRLAVGGEWKDRAALLLAQVGFERHFGSGDTLPDLLQRARLACEKVAEERAAENDVQGQLIAALSLASVDQQLGREGEARTAFLTLQAERRAAGDLFGESQVLRGLLGLKWIGEPPLSEEQLLERQVEIAREEGNPREEAQSLGLLAFRLAKLQRSEQARAARIQAVRLLAQAGDYATAAQQLWMLGASGGENAEEFFVQAAWLGLRTRPTVSGFEPGFMGLQKDRSDSPLELLCILTTELCRRVAKSGRRGEYDLSLAVPMQIMLLEKKGFPLPDGLDEGPDGQLRVDPERLFAALEKELLRILPDQYWLFDREEAERRCGAATLRHHVPFGQDPEAAIRAAVASLAFPRRLNKSQALLRVLGMVGQLASTELRSRLAEARNPVLKRLSKQDEKEFEEETGPDG